MFVILCNDLFLTLFIPTSIKFFYYRSTYATKKERLTATANATQDLASSTMDMIELKALYYKEKLKIKLREVEAKESIAESLKIIASKDK